MSIFNQIKPNEPTVGLEGYFISMYGQSKVGKTTFIYELIQDHYNNDLSKALILAIEKGYKALRGVHAMDITGFEDPDIIAENEEDQHLYGFGFVQAIDSLIAERASIPYKLIIIDTLSALQRYAGKYVAEKWSIKDEKDYENVGDIEWGNGYNYLQEAIYEQIDRLKKAGFGVIAISHDKVKSIKPKTGSEWMYTTLNLETKVADIVVREADINMYAQLTTKGLAGGKVESKRKLIIRSEGDIECGSRFKTMPNEMEFSAHTFLEEFKKAVEALYDNDEKKIEEQSKKEAAEVEKRSEPSVSQKKSNKKTELEEPDSAVLHDVITQLYKKHYADRKDELGEILLETLGKKNYKKVDDVDQLNSAIKVLKEQAKKADDTGDSENED